MKLQKVAIVITVVNLLVLGLLVFEITPKAAGDVLESVKTRRFELVDGAGKVRVQINTEESGEVIFRLRDASGTIRTKFGADAEGSGLVLMDDRTEATVQIRSDKKGSGITIIDREGRKTTYK
jgi:hypothetical protein